ncbi:MIF4G-domain-containing protein [Piedraia hortae CBS 480.64]|uniref:Pre-mRNA-splicing factor CWC22 n=1 Tax=Piedraia hortae CBS 480.64 TaxID=1314780 RepID=A0A6A7BVG8_9PEZI|nr:MIF4G-domain-containing protein [Piedraia hortae CBS 480.64]
MKSVVRVSSPVAGIRDVDRDRAAERIRQQKERHDNDSREVKKLSEADKQALAKAEYDKLLLKRSGGTYIPPARLKALQAQITDKTSKEYQRMAWEALKKSINGLVNKVSVANIKHIVPELFSENLIRGRALFCRSIMKAQAAFLEFTPTYAALAAVVNTKLPQVGILLANRLVIQFQKAFRRNDKAVCNSSTTFIAHLINQQVIHEMLAAQMLVLLLHNPSNDSVEIAVNLMKEVGQHMEAMNSKIAMTVYDQFRNTLHEADINQRVQTMIEVLFQIRRERYKNNPAIKEELDLIEEEDQITHHIDLSDKTLDTEDGLNYFKFDPDYEANEEAYQKLKAEILGEGSEDEGESEGGAEDESSEDEDEEEKAMAIKDQSNADLVNLRRSIYLTIMSSGGFEEACHKLMRIKLPIGQEEELPKMIIDCSSQERTYNKFYGLIGERFCRLNRLWQELFEKMFAQYYETIHRYETNRLRIIAQFFGYLLSCQCIRWEVLSAIKLNEEETTSSSRIFIKILVEELASGMGIKALAEKLKSEELQPALAGIFPTDIPKNTRFSINFFTSIKMGVLTEGMREWLQNRPTLAPAALPERSPTPSSSYDSYDSYSSYSRSPSRSLSPRRRQGSRSPPRRRRSRSPSRRDRSRSSPWRDESRSPPHWDKSPSPPRRKRSRSPLRRDRSRSPPRRNKARSTLRRDQSCSPVRRDRSHSPPRRDRSRGPPRRIRTRSPLPRRRRRRSLSSESGRYGSPGSRSPSPKRSRR